MDWTKRYRHTFTASIRVWPRTNATHEASYRKAEWPVCGMTVGRSERLELCSRRESGKLYYSWELDPADEARLSAAGALGVKFGKMTVRTPGTLDNTVKKECWLEAEFTVNPKGCECFENQRAAILKGDDAAMRKQVEDAWSDDERRVQRWLHEEWGWTKAQAKAIRADVESRTLADIHFIVNPDCIDVASLAEMILEGKAIAVDLGLRGRFPMERLRESLRYWTVPGRKCDEPGGEFCGYQLAGSVFWCEGASIPEWIRAEGKDSCKAYRREERGEKRLAKAQRWILEHVADRIGARYSVNRNRVASRLLESGFYDWMVAEASRLPDTDEWKNRAGIDARCRPLMGEMCKVICYCIDSVAIRPPETVAPLLTPEQQEARREYRLKQLDKLNKLSPEEREAEIARREKRKRNRPENIVKRMVANYAAEEGRDVDETFAELAAEGIFDLLLNGAKTRREHAGHSTGDVEAAFIERIGTKAIRVFKACDTGAMVAECMGT